MTQNRCKCGHLVSIHKEKELSCMVSNCYCKMFQKERFRVVAMFKQYVIYDFDDVHEKIYWCKSKNVKFNFWSKFDKPENYIKGWKIPMLLLLGFMKAEGLNPYLEDFQSMNKIKNNGTY